MEKFIKFLEDNNAWENFERNFIEQGGGGGRKRIQKVLQNTQKLTFKLRIHVVKDKRRARILV